MDTKELVHEFHEAFNVADKNIPWLGDPKLNALRVDLLQEELDELSEALEAGDEVEVLDALTDLQYVLDGAYLQLGFSPIKEEAFREVHRSNMSKLGADGFPIYREDGKVLKGPSFSEPDLSSLIDAFKFEVNSQQEEVA